MPRRSATNCQGISHCLESGHTVISSIFQSSVGDAQQNLMIFLLFYYDMNILASTILLSKRLFLNIILSHMTYAVLVISTTRSHPPCSFCSQMMFFLCYHLIRGCFLHFFYIHIECWFVCVQSFQI